MRFVIGDDNRTTRRSHKGHKVQSATDMFQDQKRSNWVRLQTLVTLRWIAIVGQIAALLVAAYGFGLQFQFGLATATIGASVIVNLLVGFIHPMNKRLTEREAALMLMFDLVQLSALLYLTGGLSNPFALLILAPVTIAATVLHLNSSLLLGSVAIAAISIIAAASLPITTMAGVPLELPALFQFGFWVALVIGVTFLALYVRQVTTEMHNMSEALLATKLALAREQKLSDLGGVVAAAAHELGTPLATIMLVSEELRQELTAEPELKEDADLIHDQAIRCREILTSMGRAGKDDQHLRVVPFEVLIRDAAEPHLHRGKNVRFMVGSEDIGDSKQPLAQRRPEIIHGLRNLVQNAVDFASGTVDISVSWSETELRIKIADDGDGFPQSVIRRIGNPFVGRWRQVESRQKRPGYEGMGLGLFIAKTLLERTGARLFFTNASSRQTKGGAVITVVWDRSDQRIIANDQLSENPQNPEF
mgnify:CR=1 FL=1